MTGRTREASVRPSYPVLIATATLMLMPVRSQAALVAPGGAPGLSTFNLQTGGCLEDPDDPRVQGVQCQYSLAQAGSFNGSFNLSGLALSSFLGPSPLQIDLGNQFLLSGTCDDDDRGDGCFVSSSLLWAGSLAATYGYAPGVPPDPTPVPEPSTLPLLALGLLGAAMHRATSRSARL